MFTDDEISKAVGAVSPAAENVAQMIAESCPGPHRYVQHRDRKPPWCPACRYTAAGRKVSQ